MKYILIILLAILLLACGNGKGGKINEPHDGGHGIGIDTATIHQIDSLHEEGWDKKMGLRRAPPIKIINLL